MTNEERIEEIIFEIHRLDKKEPFFELIKVLSVDNLKKDRVDVYEMAYKIIKNDEKYRCIISYHKNVQKNYTDFFWEICVILVVHALFLIFVEKNVTNSDNKKIAKKRFFKNALLELHRLHRFF